MFSQKMGEVQVSHTAFAAQLNMLISDFCQDVAMSVHV
jgi:hypothetical protein